MKKFKSWKKSEIYLYTNKPTHGFPTTYRYSKITTEIGDIFWPPVLVLVCICKIAIYFHFWCTVCYAMVNYSCVHFQYWLLSWVLKWPLWGKFWAYILVRYLLFTSIVSSDMIYYHLQWYHIVLLQDIFSIIWNNFL